MTASRSNWATNPAFAGQYTAGKAPTWGFDDNVVGTPTWSEAAGIRGSAQRLQYTGQAGDDANKAIWMLHPVTPVGSFAPGQPATFSFWWYGTISGVDNLRATIEAFKADGTSIGQVNPVITSMLGGTWGRAYATYSSLPAETSKIQAGFWAIGWAQGDTIDVVIDQALIEKDGAMQPYFDGDSPECGWSGTAHASTSFQSGDLNPLFDGNLSVLIGNLEVAEAMYPGLRLSTTMPGGFGEAGFQLPAVAPFGGYPPGSHISKAHYSDPSPTRGSSILIVHDVKTLFEGEVTNDISTATFSGGAAFYDVAAGGLYNKARQRDDYRHVWQDNDITQWHPMKRTYRNYEVNIDGKIDLRAEKRDTTSTDKDGKLQAGFGCSVYYWVDDGLADTDIHHIVFDADWNMGNNFSCKVQRSTSPWGTWTTSDWSKTDTNNNTDIRDPASGSYAAGTRAVRFLLMCDSDASVSDDRFLTVKHPKVYTESSAVALHSAMIDVANDTGLATSTSGSSIGSPIGVNVRPYTTRADALEQLAAKATSDVAFAFWEDAAFSVAAQSTPGSATYTVSAAEPGVDYDIHRRDEGVPDYVRILYKFHDPTDSTVYPDGTIRQVAVAASGVDAIDWTDAAKRVTVLDYSGRAMDEDEAETVATRFLSWLGRNAWEGTITIRDGRVPLTAGGTTLTAYIRAGEWISEATHGVVTGPLLIRQTEYEADSGTMTLTIGEDRDRFKLRVRSWLNRYSTSDRPDSPLEPKKWRKRR